MPETSAARETLADADAGTSTSTSTDRRILHTAADMRRLVTYVATHWKVPRVEVVIDRFAELDRQRAQRTSRGWPESGEYQPLGAWAAVVTVILGTIWIVQSFNERTIEQRFVDTYVTSAGLWKYGLWLALAAGGAWIAGNAWEHCGAGSGWLLALCRLWLRARSLESAG